MVTPMVAMTLLLLLLLRPYAHLLAWMKKIGKEEKKETKEENFVLEGHMKKESEIRRPMSSSNFNRKRIGCKSNYNSSRRTSYKSSF